MYDIQHLNLEDDKIVAIKEATSCVYVPHCKKFREDTVWVEFTLHKWNLKRKRMRPLNICGIEGPSCESRANNDRVEAICFKTVETFTYLGRRINSAEMDINIRIAKT